MTTEELTELKRAKFIIQEFLNDKKDYEDLTHAIYILNKIIKDNSIWWN